MSILSILDDDKLLAPLEPAESSKVSTARMIAREIRTNSPKIAVPGPKSNVVVAYHMRFWRVNTADGLLLSAGGVINGRYLYYCRGTACRAPS